MKNVKRYAEMVDELKKWGKDLDPDLIIAAMSMDIARSLAIIADVIEEQAEAKDEQEESEE